jgi:hypothetical protein
MQLITQNIGTNATMNLQSRVPTCIRPDYWKRHELSRQDIDTIVSYIPTKVIWMCAIMHGIACPWFTLRCSSSTTTDITLSGKSGAVDLLLERTNLTPSNNSHKLDTESIESFEHIPPIPKSRIGKHDFMTISCGIVSQLLPRRLLSSSDAIGLIPLIYRYNDLDWVPIGIEGDSICCNAIQKESLYTYKDSGGYTHDPMVGNYQNEIYCLTDEVILLTTDG